MAGTTIDLGTSAGGLAEGFHRAGLVHLLVVENNEDAAATLLQNRAVRYDPLAPAPTSLNDRWPLYADSAQHLGGDIRKFRDFPRFRGRTDALTGAPPCGMVSRAGKRQGEKDERDRNMWPEVLSSSRPDPAEGGRLQNVAGIKAEWFRPYFEYIQRALATPTVMLRQGESWEEHNARLEALPKEDLKDDLQYDVHVETLNAADSGAPQARERVFVVAFRKDLGLAHWRMPRSNYSKTALRHDQVPGKKGRVLDRHGSSRGPSSGRGSSPRRTVCCPGGRSGT